MTAALPPGITHCLERLARAVKPRERAALAEAAQDVLQTMNESLLKRANERRRRE